MSSLKNYEFNSTEKDELVVVQLPRKDVAIMRRMIEEREALSVMKGKIYAFIFFGLAGITTIITFSETIKKSILSLFGV